jgi:DNA-binding NarL/FixJ family response regulator
MSADVPHITGPRRPTRPGGHLTRRQIQILTLAANGCTTQQIADRLEIRYATVQERLHRTYTKLGARNRTHAVAVAVALRIIDPVHIHIPDELRRAA